MQVSIEINGLDRLRELAAKYPQISAPHFNQAIARSLVRVRGAAIQEAPVGVNHALGLGWKEVSSPFEGRLVSTTPYASDVELGTLPHYVSAQALMPWAAKKGLNPYAVAKSIAKKGTKANPFLDRAVASQEGGINEEFEAALEKVVTDLSIS